MNFCTNCGAKLDDGAKFCTNCGNIVDSIPSAPDQSISNDVSVQPFGTSSQETANQSVYMQPIPDPFETQQPQPVQDSFAAQQSQPVQTSYYDQQPAQDPFAAQQSQNYGQQPVQTSYYGQQSQNYGQQPVQTSYYGQQSQSYGQQPVQNNADVYQYSEYYTYASTALTRGIISCVTSFAVIPGIILGISAIKNRNAFRANPFGLRSAKPIVGMALGIAGIVTSAILAIYYLALTSICSIYM